MLRLKLIPFLVPVIAGAAFLWHRSRKKSKRIPDESSEDDGLANCCDDSTDPAAPSPLASLCEDPQQTFDDRRDSETIDDEAELSILVADDTLLDQRTPEDATAAINNDDDVVFTAGTTTVSAATGTSPSQDATQDQEREGNEQQKMLRRSNDGSLAPNTAGDSGSNLKSASGIVEERYVVASKNGNNNGASCLNNGNGNSNGFNGLRNNGVYRRRTRGSISDSVTSTGSECENWRENMGKSWEPLPEPRSASSSSSSSSALPPQQQQQPQQQLSQQQRGNNAGRNSSTPSVVADEKSANPSTTTTKNGIIVTYPPVSNKNKRNTFHQNNNHHPHHHFHGFGSPNGMSSSPRGNGASPPPPPPLPPVHPDQHVVYEFSFPSEYIGRLIGKGGRNLQQMTKETNAQINVRKEPLNAEAQIVVVHGRHADVQNLLQSIRAKFPKHRHPTVDMSPINVPLCRELTTPTCLPLPLPDDGAPFDAVVASVISAGQIFLQLPAHPTFPNLPRLDACMLSCYAAEAAPPLPTPIESGSVCAAPLAGGWFRAQFVQMLDDASDNAGGDAPSAPSSPAGVDVNNGMAWMRWVDYGGYSQVPVRDMRQMRSDFLTLPFQAIECYMANLSPPTTTTQDDAALNGSAEFSFEAAVFLEEAVQNAVIQAQVVGFAADDTPNVHLFRGRRGGREEEERTLINKELVDKGFATWVEGAGLDEAAGSDVFR